MTRTRTPFSCSCPTSRSSASRNSPIRLDTSSRGRRQFSLENANSVSASIPRREHSLMHMRTGSRPALCPAARGRPCAAAQRPLPSMMIATCRGRFKVLSNLHDLFFFGREQLVDLRDVLVGELLHVALGATLVVLGDLFLLQQLLDVVHHVAAHVTHGD